MSTHRCSPTSPGPVSRSIEERAPTSRWPRVRRAAGYGAAGTMALYLLVKCLWVGSALLGGDGPEGWRTTDWIVLNAVTAAMAVAGVTLGLALAQDWGFQLPAPLVLVPAWIGAGFLVPVLPYMLLSPLVSDTAAGDRGTPGGSGSGEAAMPSWEVAFITVGFIGMAIGLAIALPIYLRERWPAATTGRVAALTSNLPPRAPRAQAARTALACGAAIAVGLLWLFWAAGGTIGLDPVHRDVLTGRARLLIASSGLWAFAGGWAMWVLSAPARAPRVRLWVPMAVAFAASGSMFAWSCWRLPLALLRPSGYASVEYPAVAVLEHGASMTAGLAMVFSLLHLYKLHDQRQT